MLYVRLLIIFIVTGFTFFSAGLLFGVSLAEEHSTIEPIIDLVQSVAGYFATTYSGVAQAMPALFNNFSGTDRLMSPRLSAEEFVPAQRTLLFATCRPRPIETPITSVVDYLIERGFAASLSDRIRLAESYGLEGYTGSSEDNQALLDRFISFNGPGSNLDSAVCDR